jgi:hypothetical protein
MILFPKVVVRRIVYEVNEMRRRVRLAMRRDSITCSLKKCGL